MLRIPNRSVTTLLFIFAPILVCAQETAEEYAKRLLEMQKQGTYQQHIERLHDSTTRQATDPSYYEYSDPTLFDSDDVPTLDIDRMYPQPGPVQGGGDASHGGFNDPCTGLLGQPASPCCGLSGPALERCMDEHVYSGPNAPIRPMQDRVTDRGRGPCRNLGRDMVPSPGTAQRCMQAIQADTTARCGPSTTPGWMQCQQRVSDEWMNSVN